MNNPSDKSLETLSSEDLEGQNLCSKLKNVSKNYGRAICKFILTQDISGTYLKHTLEIYNIENMEFLNYIREKKANLNGINEFRAMLLVTAKDDEKTISFNFINTKQLKCGNSKNN